jgi:hypothetical protein
MPMWLAKLTPLLFDSIQAVEIVAVARRYGELVARWGGLAPEAWERVKTAFLIRTVDEAMEAARPVSKRKPYWPAVEAACNNTKSALESGDKKALKAARAARAVEAAVWAVEAVEGAAAARAVWTAEEAAGAAEAEGAETEAVAVWTAAAEGAGAAVQAETEAVFCLRLFTFILDRIEAECP